MTDEVWQPGGSYRGHAVNNEPSLGHEAPAANEKEVCGTEGQDEEDDLKSQ